MKKILALLTLICLMFTMVSCGPDEPDQPDTPETYSLTQDIVDKDLVKIAPEIETHSFGEDDLEGMIAAQEYYEDTKTVKADIRVTGETPVYVYTGVYRVEYKAVNGELVLDSTVRDTWWIELKDGAYPGEYACIQQIESLGHQYVEEQDIYVDGESGRVGFLSTRKDGNKLISEEGYLLYRYDFDKEDWEFTGSNFQTLGESMSYDDHTGIYDLILSDEYETTSEGLVIKAYRLKEFYFDDAYVDGLRVGDVIDLKGKRDIWTGEKLQNIKMNCCYWDDQWGKEILIVRENPDYDFYFFEYDSKQGKWKFCREYLFDGPGNGSLYYVGSEMNVLITEDSKVTKMAYFDQTYDEKLKDITKLFKGNTNCLLCQTRVYHGIVDWCTVEWPIAW